MADPINTAQAPTLAGTMPELQAALAQAAAGLPPEVIQQGLGAAAAFDPMLAEQAARRQNELKPSMAQAEAAAKAYEAQAAATPPVISGARAGLNELLGSVASILSGNQTYRESAATRLQKEQQALLDSRSQNLTRLKDLYDKRAEAAKSLGNDIAEEENRIKKDRIEKALEPINKAREHQYQMEELARRDAGNKVELERLSNSAINTLVDNWRQSQDLKSYREMTVSLNKAKQFAVGGTTVSDIALINAFAKANDERTGVRTEEFKVYEKAAGWLADQLNLGNRLQGKGLLPPDVRLRIVQETQNLVNAQRPLYEAAYRAAFAQGRAMNIPDDKIRAVLTGYGPPVIIDDFVDTKPDAAKPGKPTKPASGLTKEKLDELKKRKG